MDKRTGQTHPRLARSSRALRWPRLIAAASVGILCSVAIITGIIQYATSTPDWGMTLDASGPQSTCYPVICTTYAWRVARVDVGGLAFNNGINVGTVICGYSDSQITPGNVTSMTNAASVIMAQQLVILQSGNKSNACHLPSLTSTVSAGQVTLLSALGDLLIELISASLAILIVLHGTQRNLVWHTAAFLVSMVLTFGTLPLVTNSPVLEIAAEVIASLVTPTLLATLLWRLLLSAPTRPLGTQGRAILFALLFILNAALAAGLLFAVAFQHANIYNFLVKVDPLLVVVNVLITLGTVIGIGLFSRDAVRRDNARILGIGTLIALLPVLVFAVLPAIIPNFHPLIDSTAVATSLGVFPLALAYVVLRRDLLHTDVLVRRTAVQAIWLIFLAFTSALLLTVLAGVLNISAQDAALLFAGLIVLGLVAPLLNNSARWITEAGIFPEVQRYRRLLRRARVGGQTEEREIADALIGEVTIALPIRSATLLVRHDEVGLYEVVGGLAIPPVTVDHPILAAFTSRPLAVVREDLAPYGPLPFEPPPSSFWECFVPIVLENRLVGLLLLGPRDDDIGYSTTDRTQLFRLANQRAVALDYLRVLSALRAALEEQKRIDALKDQFIMTAHHELRTPLTSMMGYIDIVARMGVTSWQQDPDDVELMVSEALRSGEDLVHLLDTLLAADRASVRSPVLHPAYIALGETLRRLATDAMMAGAEQAARISITCPPELVAYADRDAFGQIITNLLSNAAKYSPEHAPIEVTVWRKEDAPLVEITVRDYGDGVPLDQQSAIFEKFIRLERDLNSTIRGTGLGLAIVRDRVQAMGGNVWVESTGIPGEGATFHVTLPSSAADVALPDAPTDPALPVAVAATPAQRDLSAELTDTLPRHKLVRYGPPAEG